MRKKLINLVNNDGTISKIEMEIPDDQADMPEVPDEEFERNQPLKKQEFVNVLNKTYGDLNSAIGKINELETKIKSLESIIIEHNNLLKSIVKIISK